MQLPQVQEMSALQVLHMQAHAEINQAPKYVQRSTRMQFTLVFAQDLGPFTIWRHMCDNAILYSHCAAAVTGPWPYIYAYAYYIRNNLTNS